MCKRRWKKLLFLQNTNAISEEFTVLPALSIVLLGIIIMFILIGKTYIAHNEQTILIDSIHATDQIYNTIIQPSNPSVIQSGIIDYETLYSLEGKEFIYDLQKQYKKIGMNFSLFFSFDNISFWYPRSPANAKQRISVTHLIGLAINDICTKNSELSVLVWNIEEEIT